MTSERGCDNVFFLRGNATGLWEPPFYPTKVRIPCHNLSRSYFPCAQTPLDPMDRSPLRSGVKVKVIQ